MYFSVSLLVVENENIFLTGMMELHERHTGQNLKEEVCTLLKQFNIELRQVYSATIDNGRNMVKAVSLLEQEASEEFSNSCNNEGENSLSEDETMDYPLDDLQKTMNHNVISIRCGAHTAQLVVTDSCKEHQSVLKTLSKLATSYRNQKFKNFFDVSCGKYPPIPVPTRWNSYYMMLNNLYQQKEFFNKLGEEYGELSKYNRSHCFYHYSF